MRSDASAKWLAAGSGENYERSRFQSARARHRDLACVLALIDRVHGNRKIERVLDAPCGSGRLTHALAERSRHYVGLDISRDMLRAAAGAFEHLSGRDEVLEADALAMPFGSGQFDVVVACRWLHHLREEKMLRAAIGELVRVSRGVVIASFWDERSLPGWRRRLWLKRPEGPAGRSANSREQVTAWFDQAGADVVAWRATLRFVSQQTFVAARVRDARR